MSFSSMHDDYLDPDRAGLNDEQPIDLQDGRALKGYGRAQHGLNGKDADLDYGGQNYIKSALWFEDGTIHIEGRRYASIVPCDGASDEQIDVATAIVCDSCAPGEWDGDYWGLGEDYSLDLHLDWNNGKSEEENIDAACRPASDAINADSEDFENDMAETAKQVADATRNENDE